MTTSARACLGATCAALLLAGCSSPQASSAGWNPYAAYERPIQADPPEETEQPPEVEEVSPASLRLVVFVDSGELEAIKAALQAAIDRSGTPERPAAGSVKELELAGDPALQTYTRWTGGRHHGKEPILIAGYEVSFRAKLGDGLDPMRAVWIGKDKQTFDLGSRKSAAQLIELGLGRYRLTFDFEKPTPVKPAELDSLGQEVYSFKKIPFQIWRQIERKKKKKWVRVKGIRLLEQKAELKPARRTRVLEIKDLEGDPHRWLWEVLRKNHATGDQQQISLKLTHTDLWLTAEVRPDPQPPEPEEE